MRTIFVVLLLCALGAVVFLAVTGCDRASSSEHQDVRVRKMMAELVPLFELTPLESRVSGIVEVERAPWPRGLRGTKCVLIVRGSARYGIDLNRSALERSGEGLVLTLPKPHVSAAYVDMERSRTWQSTAGVLSGSKRLEDEGLAWKEAVALIRESAQQAVHIAAAQRQAELAISRLAQSLDEHTPVQVRWMDEHG